MHRTKLIENEGKHILDIMNAVDCKRHGATHGDSCWPIYSDATNEILPAICGSRIKRVGYMGEISPDSLS